MKSWVSGEKEERDLMRHILMCWSMVFWFCRMVSLITLRLFLEFHQLRQLASSQKPALGAFFIAVA